MFSFYSFLYLNLDQLENSETLQFFWIKLFLHLIKLMDKLVCEDQIPAVLKQMTFSGRMKRNMYGSIEPYLYRLSHMIVSKVT